MITNRSFYGQMSDRQFADPEYVDADLDALIGIAERDLEDMEAITGGDCGTFREVFNELVSRILKTANPVFQFRELNWKYEVEFDGDIFIVRPADGRWPIAEGAGSTLRKAVDMAEQFLRKDLAQRIDLCKTLGEDENVKLFQEALAQLEERVK